MSKAKQPLVVQNSIPEEGHRKLDPTIGTWKVEKSLYIMGGTPEKPMVSNEIVCCREWIEETGNRHIKDVTKGTLGGNPYYRLGICSYSNMDKRYEWNTVDAINTSMMTYKGKRGSGLSQIINMSGDFIDQGLLGDDYAGKLIQQRVELIIESTNRSILNMYFTAPAEQERLIDHSVYTRM